MKKVSKNPNIALPYKKVLSGIAMCMVKDSKYQTNKPIAIHAPVMYIILLINFNVPIFTPIHMPAGSGAKSRFVLHYRAFFGIIIPKSYGISQ
jgi:hypothetical protein